MSDCLWPMDDECLPDTWNDVPEAVQTRALALASKTLHRLTGGRVGHCSITLRPCKPREAFSCSARLPFYYDRSYTPFIHNGAWINSCGCSTPCGHTSICEVDLPGPVGRVDEVKVDGAVIAPADYRVDNGHLLVFTGVNDCPFPATQDLSLPDTEPGTFAVTYLNAYPVDSGGQRAVALLAAEWAKACQGQKCALPKGVTNIVRQGISMTVTTEAFPNGLTGISEVDAWVALWNPGKLIREASVWSPDLPVHRTRTL